MSTNNTTTNSTTTLAATAGLSTSKLFALDNAKVGAAPGLAICYEMREHNGYLNAAAVADGTDISISIAGMGAAAGDVLEMFIDGDMTKPFRHVLLAEEISNAKATGVSTATTVQPGVGVVHLTAADLAALSQGTHNVTSRIHYMGKDIYSDVSPAIGKLRIDTIAPNAPTAPDATDNVGQTTGLINQGAVTDDAEPLISGTVSETGNTVEVFDNGVSLGKAVVQSNGKWTLLPSTPLADGQHAITLIETDSHGNPSPTSPALNFVVDTGNASIVIANAQDNAGDIQGNVASGGVTDDTTPTLVGTAKANAVVTIHEGNTVVGTTTADAQGHWSFTPAGVQAEGKHTYTASITVAGNTVTSAGFVITVDTIAPDVTVTPQGDSFKTAAEATSSAGIITVTSEADSVSTVTFHGTKGDVVKTIANNGSAKPVVLTAADLATLGDGAVEVTTVTKDKAGNTITTADVNDGDFTLDTVPPDVTVIAQGNAIKTASEATSSAGIITVSSDPDTVSTVTFHGVKGDVVKTITHDGTTKPVVLTAADLATLGDGAVEVTTVTQDKAGNTITTPDVNDGDFTLDTAPSNITGDTAKTTDETDAAQTLTGNLTSTDVHGVANTFQAIASVTGTGGYGSFSMTAAGKWTYVMNGPHNEFVQGQSYTDSFTAQAADGSTKVITVTLNGTNDAAVISGTTTATLTETDAAQSATGTLTSTDVDGVANAFQAANNVAGSNGYGSFTMTAAGVWTYTMNGAHNEFVQGQSYTDSFTAKAADGTAKLITVTMNGGNDAAVISGAATATLTQSGVAQTATGTLTSTDVDGVANAFQAIASVTGTGGYGSFSMTAAGVWTYTMNGAHTEFVQGQSYTDSFTAKAADGTAKVITVTLNGTNDAAVISGTTTATLTETDAAQSATGTLTSTDVDGVANAFQAVAGVLGTGGYGSFSMTDAGVWTYTMNGPHNEFVAGQQYTDSFTAKAADGTAKVITVTINGTNDASLIGGVSTASLIETDAAQSATGTLTLTTVDNVASTFQVVSGVTGTGGYGSFSMTAAGVWTYTMNGPHNEFVFGQTYTDSFTAKAADGTAKVVTVTLNGTNDAAVISGTTTATLTETNAVQTATGMLSITDADSAATFVAQTGTAGSNGYGKFSLSAAGVWTYSMNTAHDEFVAGTAYTDSFTAVSADGTTKVITVTINGTNDAAVIGGTSTATLTQSATAQTATGTLSITDVDGAATFVAQTNVAGSNGYGKFSVNAAGVWTYTMNTAHAEFVAGTAYTDSITVASADGTTKVIIVTINGTNDAAVISGTTTATLTETDAAQTATGTLTSTDVDGAANAFQAASSVAGSNGYGSFSMTAAGVWTYTMNGAHNEFVQGQSYTDSFTAKAADGTTKVVTVTINGTNDAAVIGGTSTATLTQSATAQTATGTLSITDVDGAATFVAQTNVAGSNGYGSFSVTAAGVWTYTMNSAHAEFVAGTAYTDSITVAAADGTTKVVTVTINGTNDAAVISGTTTATLTETNAVQTATGTLTVTDADSAATFVAQTATAGSNGYGKFSLTAAGAWTYTMNTAHDEFVAGTAYTDSFTAVSADGTTKVITVTINGTNDAAVISGTSTATLTQSATAQTATGTLSITDVDGAATFVAQTNVAGNNGYGKFSVNAAGVWTYTMNSAHAEFVAGTAYTDSITVASADGTTKVVTVTINGTNDAAVISGTTTGSVTEAGGVANAIAGTPTATGTLTSADADGVANAFTAVSTATATTGGYGTYTLSAAGVWTYTLNNSNATVQALSAGTTLNDTFTVTTADGTAKVITVTINGTNDAAVIGGTSTATLTQSATAQTATGTLSITDVDGAATFVAQANVAGSNGYGSFSVTAAGVWTYTMNSAHAEFVAGTAYTDSITVAAADGTTKVVTVTINGANDAAVIGGVSTATLTETNAVQTATGTLSITDADSAATFVAQTATAGSNGYGKFSLNTAGVWTYTMNTAHDEFVAGTAYTDSFTAVSADGTTKVITVTINGTNDAAVISGTSTATLTQSATAQTATGTLSITDADSAATFVAQANVAGSNGYGKFSISVAGAWTYTMNSAHAEFVAGTAYTDSITVAAADGTTKVITVTINGTNDAAVISGTSAATLTETDAAQTATGTLTSTDVDGVANAFQAITTPVAGSYGSFTLTAAGKWTYTMDGPHNEFVQGQTYTDSFNAKAADGTIKVVTVTLNGTNDAAVIGGTGTVDMVETGTVQTFNGTLTSSDIDGTDNLFQGTISPIMGKYGDFGMNSAGEWVYHMSSSHAEFVEGTVYTDTFTVKAADGTAQVVTINITGTNDAAVIGGVTVGSITETNAAQSVSGLMTITDVDSAASFQALTGLAGKNGYGSFSLTAAGKWTYTMDSAHNEFAKGVVYTDSFVAQAADGTNQTITVNIVGTNDAPVLTHTTLNMTSGDAAPVNGATAGTAVSSFVGGITDADLGAITGIAISAANANGTLYFSTDSGTTWTKATSLSDTHALGLTNAAQNRVYFVPNAGATQTISDAFTFHAWDRSGGAPDGSYINYGTNVGGINSVSTGTDTVSATLLDNQAPVMISSNPGDNGYMMSLGNNLTLTFSEAIMQGTGLIQIYKADGTLVESFSAFASPLVTGWGTSTLTINPTSDLLAGTGYYVKIAATAIKDMAGNAYAGINDATTLNFMTTNTDGGINPAATTGVGYVVSSAGDVNGDGFDDVIVGAPAMVNEPYTGQYVAGGAYVIYGNANGTLPALTMNAAGGVNASIAASAGFKISTGLSANSRLGATVSGLGDINGDGFDDVLVGDGGTNAVAYVVYGKATNTGVSLDTSGNINNSQGFKISLAGGFDSTANFGSVVTGLGDVNGDGVADFGVRISDIYSYVVYGSTTNQSDLVADSRNTFAIDSTRGYRIGGLATAVGDMNNDGLADVVSTTFNSLDSSYAASVYYSNANGTANTTNVAYKITGTISNSPMRQVTSMGDVNGDGIGDLAVLSYNQVFVVYGQTSTTNVVLSTLSASQGYNINLPSGSSYYDWVSSAGDVNGDGLADVIIGKQNSGVNFAMVVYGNATGSTVQLSHAAGATNVNEDSIAASLGFKISSPAAALIGYRVSNAGDFNGDGLADLIVGGLPTTGGSFGIVLGGTQYVTMAVQGSGTVTGTSGSEAILGSATDDLLIGGGGVDRFFGGQGNDAIVLTANDVTNLGNVATGQTVKASVDGGGGYDTLRLSGGANVDLTTISNAGAMGLEENSRIESIERIDLATDTAANTLTLTAKDVKDMAGFNSIHTGTVSADGNTWTNVTGTALSATTKYHQLVVDGGSTDSVVLAADNGFWTNAGTVSNGSSNYTVYQNVGTNSQVLVKAGVVVTNNDSVAPVVIDMNHDGALTYGHVTMDVNGDGQADTTAWAGAQDGVLVWDKYQDNVVHDNSQYAFSQYGKAGSTDLQGLAAAFDSNQDGVFDARDAKFAQFSVWQDANQNGVSDAGEVHTLAEAGIASIHLNSDSVARNPADGVFEAGRTTATGIDGQSVLVADAAFEFHTAPAATTAPVVVKSASAHVLSFSDVLPAPDWQAHDVTSAHVAYSINSTSALTDELMHKVAV